MTKPDARHDANRPESTMLKLVDDTKSDWASTPTQLATHNIEVVVNKHAAQTTTSKPPPPPTSTEVVVADPSPSTTTLTQPQPAPSQHRRSRTAQFSVYNYNKTVSRTPTSWMMSSLGTVI